MNSKQGIQFRIWATQRLKYYLVKGYSINEKRLKESKNQLVELKKTVELLNNYLQSVKIRNRQERSITQSDRKFL